MTKRIDTLLQTICGAGDHPLAPFLRQWCTESRLFLAFAEAHATKIRKKVRLAPSEDEQADLLAELALAAFLLRDRRFTLVYEPGLATGQRGPDFQVIFKTHSPFHAEVTRLRFPNPAEDDGSDAVRKLARVMCDKIGQFPAGAVNLLVVVIPPGRENGTLLPAAVRLLDGPPHPEGSELPAGLQPEGVRAYLRVRQRLSAVVLCSFTAAWQPSMVRLWLNPGAKHPLDPDVNKYLTQKLI